MTSTLAEKTDLPGSWRRPDVLLASLLINGLALVLPLVVFQVYDRIVPNVAEATLTMLLMMAIVVALLDGAVRVMRAILVSSTSSRFEHRATLAAMQHILHSETLSFETLPGGTHLERIQAIEKVQEFYSGQAMLLAIDLPFAALFLVLIWSMAGAMVAVPLVLLGIFLLISIWAGRSLSKALRKRSLMDERRQNFIIEVLSAIHTVKSMAMEKLMMRRYERLQGQSAENICHLGEINSIVQGTTAMISHLAVISFVSIGSMAVIAGDMTTGALAAGTMLTGRVLQPGLRALGFWTQFQNVRLSIEKIEKIFALPEEASRGYIPEDRKLGNIRIRNIRFRYPGMETEIIRGVDLDIRAGDSVSISGRNGAGKSTLVSLIMGFIKPDAGSVTIGGRDISDYDLEFMRSRISLMPQKGILFEGTVLENMTLFREGEAARQAAKLAHILGLDLFLSRLPDGLDTEIGGSAVDALPEGIRQKIIMIRALIGDPCIMLFDDANANFDMANDNRLLEFVSEMKGKRTLIIVSHRPSLLRLANQHYRLEDGQLTRINPSLAKPEVIASKVTSESYETVHNPQSEDRTPPQLEQCA